MENKYNLHEYKRPHNTRNIIIVIVAVALIITCGYVIYFNFFSSPLKSDVEIEAGTTKLKVKDFVKNDKYKASIKKGLTAKQLQTMGEHNITVTVKGHDYTTTVKVVDHTKPTLTGVSALTVDINSKPDYTKGVSVKDNAAGKVKLAVDSKAVKLNKAGTYPITYKAKDAAGNVTSESTKVKVVDLEKLMKEKVVYLTFDDGPSQNTPKILKILKKYKVKGTFFVTAQEPGYFKYMKQAHDQGNFIAAHSYTHKFSIYRSEKAYFDDLDKIEAVIKKYTGKTSPVLRFPGGSSNTASRHFANGIMTKLTKDVLKKGYQYVDWNLDSTDASGNNVPVAKLVANGTSTYSNNLCILMHDTGAKHTTVKALPAIIEYYKKHHYKFETLENSPHVYHHHVNN